MTDAERIDAMQRVRERNNANWMNLVRLAFNRAPEEARKIAADIGRCDAQIVDLMRQLGGSA